MLGGVSLGAALRTQLTLEPHERGFLPIEPFFHNALEPDRDVLISMEAGEKRGLCRKVSGKCDWHMLGVADSNWRTPRAVFVGLGDDLLINGLFREEAGALFLHSGQPVMIRTMRPGFS